jgi:hypothetical protein
MYKGTVHVFQIGFLSERYDLIIMSDRCWPFPDSEVSNMGVRNVPEAEGNPGIFNVSYREI